MKKKTIIIGVSLVICIVVIISLIVIGIASIKNSNNENKTTTDTSNDASVVVSTTDEYTEDANNSIENASSEETSNVDNETENDKTEILPDDIEENGLTVSENKKIASIIDEMTIEEKVYQMLLVRTDYLYPDMLCDYPVGGFVLFSNDFSGLSREQVIDNIKAYQSNSKIPLLICVDEEGGNVVRVSSNYNLRAEGPFNSPRYIYENGGMVAIKNDAREKSKLLLDLGINVNLGPVCDYTDNSYAFMYNRSFGVSIEETCQYISNVVSTMNDEQIGSVLKHFPGYGDCEDTHTGIVYDDRSIEQFREVDFMPFEAGINAGADSIMVSHNILSSVDSEMPSSLSKPVHQLIRDELGFDGVIMTDDLCMGAITQYIEKDRAAVQAIVAGNDLLLTDDYSGQYSAIIDAINSGEITEERIEESVKRILEWKCRLGLLK